MDDVIISLVREGKEVTSQAVFEAVSSTINVSLGRISGHFSHLRRLHSWNGKDIASKEHIKQR
jgi:hypothetical protein